MELKTYKQLQIPSDSAWDRKSLLKRYTPIWIKQIFDGISSIWKWIPVIYKDRNWDSHYIFEILKFKLIQQRKKLVEDNRHMGVESLNRDITLCLNLIERVQEDYYDLEYMDYHKSDYNWNTCENNPEYSELEIVHVSDNFDVFFKKYKCSVKKVLMQDRSLSSNKNKLAMKLAHYNQKRCQDLLFKVLNERINNWWD
jgi:hypothetical protein